MNVENKFAWQFVTHFCVENMKSLQKISHDEKGSSLFPVSMSSVHNLAGFKTVNKENKHVNSTSTL